MPLQFTTCEAEGVLKSDAQIKEEAERKAKEEADRKAKEETMVETDGEKPSHDKEHLVSVGYMQTSYSFV